MLTLRLLVAAGLSPAQDTARSLLAHELPPVSQLTYTEKGDLGKLARAQAPGDQKHLRVAAGLTRELSKCARALIINYTRRTDLTAPTPQAFARTRYQQGARKRSPD